MDPALTDPSVVDITTHKIFAACFKKVFKGRANDEAGEADLQNLRTCSKNLIESFSVVSEGFHSYVKSVPTPKDYTGAEA